MVTFKPTGKVIPITWDAPITKKEHARFLVNKLIWETIGELARKMRIERMQQRRGMQRKVT